MKEQRCKNCEHYSGSRYTKCEVALPFWAEPYSRPTVYGEDGDGCPAYEEYNPLSIDVDKSEAWDVVAAKNLIIATKDAEIARLTAENERMREALEPFAEFAENNIEHDGWGGLRCERERINVWFGPSDFIRARAALSIPDPAGGMPVEVET